MVSSIQGSFAMNHRGRRPFRRARRDRLMRRPTFEGLENRITLTANVWTGAAAQSSQDDNWSNSANWSQGTPQNGQDLVFPAPGAGNYIPTQAIVNDLPGMTFGSIEIDAPGYTITGDAITLTASPGLFTTYNSGVSTFSINATLDGTDLTIASGGELDVDGDLSRQWRPRPFRRRDSGRRRADTLALS